MSHSPTNPMLLFRVQATQSEITKRHPVSSAITDLLAQLADMAEEGALVEADQETRRITEQLPELTERLNQRKQTLKVRTQTTGPPRRVLL